MTTGSVGFKLPIRMKIVTPLKLARVQAGKGVAEFAAEVGVSRITLWRIESGRRPPRTAIRRRLCEVLAVPEDLLFPQWVEPS